VKISQTLIRRATGPALLALVVGLGGCSGFGSMTEQSTASITPPAPKVDPACAGLRTQIDALNKEGIAEKVDKAGQKKVKLTAAELAKVSHYIKLKDEYTAKCPQQAAALASEPKLPVPAVTTKTAATPPVPAVAVAPTAKSQ